MIKLYKFEDYQTIGIYPDVFYEPINANTNIFDTKYIYRKNNVVVPVPSNIKAKPNESCPIYGDIQLENINQTQVTFDDILYVHSKCTIPRAKVTQKYKRVLKPERADVCVVPKYKDIPNALLTAIFVNKDKQTAYCIEPKSYWNTVTFDYKTADICKDAPLGSKPTDICPALIGTTIDNYGSKKVLSSDNWQYFLESTLVFYGYAVLLHTSELFVADIMYNIVHDIVTEDKILATLGDENNKLTEETCVSIKEMLLSKDRSVVELGLKTLAELDYNKYRNTVVFLLKTTRCNWDRSNTNYSTSVKYMLSTLGLKSNSYGNQYSRTITSEDFELVKGFIEKDINEAFANCEASCITRYPFIEIDFATKHNIIPIIDKQPQEEDNE